MRNNTEKEGLDAMNQPLVRRFAAFLVDWYLSTFLAMLPVIVFHSINGRDLVIQNTLDGLSFTQAVAATLLAVGIWLLYFCVFPLLGKGAFRVGQTPGRRLFGLDLVPVRGDRLSFASLFLRDGVGVFLLQGNLTSVNVYLMSLLTTATGAQVIPYFHSVYYLCILVSLILLFAKKGRMLQDLIGGTQVVLKA